MKVSELRRQIGEVRGTKIVAAMAIDLTSTVPTTLLFFKFSLKVKRCCLSLFARDCL